MKEQICKHCKWSTYDRSNRQWWCGNDLSEEFDSVIDKDQTACDEYEEGNR